MRNAESRLAMQATLVERILGGPAEASAELRAQAFNGADLPEAVRPLAEKTATHSADVTDADYALATKAGYTADQLFEIVICAAVGEASRQYKCGLDALAAALAETETQ